jgi:hypothetical protein
MHHGIVTTHPLLRTHATRHRKLLNVQKKIFRTTEYFNKIQNKCNSKDR